MTTTDKFRDDLCKMLHEARIEVDTVGGTLNLSRGTGPMEAKANIDPADFLASLADEPEQAARRRLAGYARGIQHVLLEPADSEAADWDFTTAAGSLAMSLEVETFVDGCRAACGAPAFARRLDEDLVYIYLLELDMGIRVLTQRQFDNWTASPDRVFEGARSMLYHKAQSESPVDVDGHEGVEQLRVGDGYDAARCLVLDDLFFGEFDADSRIAMPTPDDLLFVRDGRDEHLRQLHRATDEIYREAPFPLSDALFRFERGKPVRTSS